MKKIILTLILFFLYGCATSGDVNYLNDRLVELEKKLKVSSEENLTKLKEKSKRYEKSSETQRENYADLEAKVHKVRNDLMKIKGKIEELDFFLKRIGKNQKSLKSMIEQAMIETRKLNKRYYKIEQYVGFEPVKKSDLKKVKKKKKLSEKDLYKLAKSKLDKGNTKEARDLFKEFLKLYPKSENADNAQFWISDIYYREKWYEKAILEYQKVIEKYPNGNKIPASYLKQGYAFYNLGEKANAKLILNELIKKHPSTNEAKLARKKLARIK